MTDAGALAERSGDLHTRQRTPVQPLYNVCRVQGDDARLFLGKQSAFNRGVADVDRWHVLVRDERCARPE